MQTEEIFYTDGQDVVVTLSTLQVKDRFYLLKNVKKHSMAILQPARIPGLIMFVLGVALTIVGMANSIPADVVGAININGKMTDANTIAQWGGIGVTILGLVFTILLRERYAVRIATEEGEKDAVVSTHREYIREIIDALNRASMMTDFHTQPRLRRI